MVLAQSAGCSTLLDKHLLAVYDVKASLGNFRYAASVEVVNHLFARRTVGQGNFHARSVSAKVHDEAGRVARASHAQERLTLLEACARLSLVNTDTFVAVRQDVVVVLHQYRA